MADHRIGTRRQTRRARRESERERHPWRVPTGIGAVLVAGTLLLWGGQTTAATWSGAASAEAGGLTHGTLDLRWNDDADDAVALADWGLSGMLPGDSRAVTITVSNPSLASSLAYDVHARATNPALAPQLTLELFLEGTATNTGSAATGFSGSCSGTSLGSAQPLTTGDAPYGAVAGPVAPGASHTLCARIVFVSTAPASVQGQTAQVVLTALVRQLDS
ncbi:hypothetical protein [Microbacterium stercoris]|uniref:Uncharacterized protein n=1 Tax=Microbacterium stercoris TaxID=2820289 RepID=A0A939QLI2_9MICO|nr:hypothetical protein [Microbacterium stercoris]MBO3665107.1 hypothetical protein [Microbacterium stercoris]